MSPLSVRIAGAETAPPLVLLHAIATSSAMWEPQIAIWADHFRVIALDLPGHGDSSGLAESCDFSGLARIVLAALDETGVARASFVGLSWGSMIAQRIAADAPERVRALVLSNGVAFAPPPVAQAWQDRIEAVQRDDMAGQIDATIDRWFTASFRVAAPLTVSRIAGLVAATSAAGYINAAKAIATLDHRGLIGGISAPTLVVAGTADVAAPPEAVRTIADAIPGAHFAQLDGGHLLNVEQATAYSELVGAFLIAAQQNVGSNL